MTKKEEVQKRGAKRAFRQLKRGETAKLQKIEPGGT